VPLTSTLLPAFSAGHDTSSNLVDAFVVNFVAPTALEIDGQEPVIGPRMPSTSASLSSWSGGGVGSGGFCAGGFGAGGCGLGGSGSGSGSGCGFGFGSATASSISTLVAVTALPDAAPCTWTFAPSVRSANDLVAPSRVKTVDAFVMTVLPAAV